MRSIIPEVNSIRLLRLALASHQTLRQQPINFCLREPGLQTRFLVERRFQSRRGVALHQQRVMRQRVESMLCAQPAKPLIANRHMTNLIAQNNFQYGLQSDRMR